VAGREAGAARKQAREAEEAARTSQKASDLTNKNISPDERAALTGIALTARRTFIGP
jgi:hypothetical protein